MTARAKKRFLPDAGAASAALDLAKTLYKIPALLTTWTRCGKPGCRCTAGHLHGPYYALHWRDGAIRRRRYVRALDVPAVRAVLAQRRAALRAEQRELDRSMRSWRELRQWAAEIEAQTREERAAR